MLNKGYERLERILDKRVKVGFEAMAPALVLHCKYFGGCSVWLGLRLDCVGADLQVKVFHFQTVEQVKEVIRIVEVVVN
jgi:hypothetical protein